MRGRGNSVSSEPQRQFHRVHFWQSILYKTNYKRTEYPIQASRTGKQTETHPSIPSLSKQIQPNILRFQSCESIATLAGGQCSRGWPYVGYPGGPVGVLAPVSLAPHSSASPPQCSIDIDFCHCLQFRFLLIFDHVTWCNTAYLGLAEVCCIAVEGVVLPCSFHLPTPILKIWTFFEPLFFRIWSL